MQRYVYRIETLTSGYWQPVEGDAHGTDEYDGDPSLVASDALRKYIDTITKSGHTGTFRVLAWCGDQEGAPDDAKGIASTCITQKNLPRGVGRPAVGGPVHVRLGDLLPDVDKWAAENAVPSRAEAVRLLVARGLNG